MSFLDRVNNAIKGWLFKEEIQQGESAHYEQIGRQVVTAIQEYEQVARKQLEEIEKIKNENHDVRPTLADIDRYYGYYKAYVEYKKHQAAHSWNSNGSDILEISKDQFEAEAQAGGWRYLRSSVGLPLPDNDSGGIWHV